MFKINKKTTAVSAATLAIVGAGSAFAYFYSDTGTGSTGTGGQSAFLTVDDPTGGPETITPNGDGRTFTVHISNSDSAIQHPSNFNVSIVNPDGSPWSRAGSVAGQPACTAADFDFTDFTPGGNPTDWNVPAATTSTATPPVTTPGSLTVTFKVRFNDNNWNQVNCLGIPGTGTDTVPVVVTVS